MKLKVQMEKQKSYANTKRNEARQRGDIAQEYYWLGVMNAMDWAPGSRNDWDYVDGEDMPKDEKMEF